MAAALELSELTRFYGPFAALDGVSFAVAERDLFGFLGQNGAGKTTAIKILARLVRPTRGSARLLGRDVAATSPAELFRKVGFLVEAPAPFPYLSGFDNLALHARLLDLPHARDACERALQRFGLAAARDKKARTYSLGMKQRLGLAQALLGEPELLVLDEPTNGLDPGGIVEVREILREEVARHGRTVFLSSHLLTEVEALCNRVAVVDRGQLVASGEVSALLMGGETVKLRASDPGVAESVCRSLALAFVRDGAAVRFHGDDAAVARAVRAIVEGGADVLEVTRQRRSLEDVYRDLTAGRTA